MRGAAVMSKMTPLQEALDALDRDLPRSGLSMAAQLEYDRLKPVWERGVPAEVLQSYRDAAAQPQPDSQPAGRAVQQSGATHTFSLHRGRLVFFGILFVGGGAVGAVGLGSVVLPNAAGDLKAWAAVGVFLCGIWMGIRMPFVAVRISGGKMTIRNLFRTYTINGSEIRAITVVGSVRGDALIQRTPEVHLTTGRSIKLTGLDETLAGHTKRDLFEDLDQIRALLGITAPLSTRYR
jgi:hypothetical protein